MARSMNKELPPRPTADEVERYLRKWYELENYRLQEDALDKLFFELCPGNADIEDVLVKASALNDFYSTNIFSIFPVAKHIRELGIDDRLDAGDLSLVDDIATVTMGDGSTRRFYSFATKYCSHHKPLVYPIYDSYVDALLRHFRKRGSFASFKNADLFEYGEYARVLVEFRAFYGLDGFTIKELDKYLWQLGKEYFPRKY